MLEYEGLMDLNWDQDIDHEGTKYDLRKSTSWKILIIAPDVFGITVLNIHWTSNQLQQYARVLFTHWSHHPSAVTSASFLDLDTNICEQNPDSISSASCKLTSEQKSKFQQYDSNINSIPCSNSPLNSILLPLDIALTK